MSISVRKLVYDFERKYNAANTGKANDYRIVDIISFLNDAYEIVVEHLIAEEDQNRAIRNHLRELFVKKHELECTKVDKDCCKISYPSDHYATSNILVEACHDCCDDSKYIPVVTTQSGDLQEARKNPYRRANFFFEQLIGDEASDGYYIYHDCEMDIKNVWIDYYKKIKRLDAPSLVNCESTYKDWDGKLIGSDSNFELSSTYINRKVSDVAVYLAGNASRDYAFSQAKLQEIININQLHR